MLQASCLAGSAFTKSYVDYVHAVAHSLGGQYNIPYGLANAVLLPIVLEAYGPCIYKRLHRLGVTAGLASLSDSDEQGARAFITVIRDMRRRLQSPDTLPGIREAYIPALAWHADREANPLYPVPCLWDAKKLERFYQTVMDPIPEKEAANV